MGLRVADRVEDWDERPVEGGYAGLSELADEEFSGVIRAGGAELFMTAGTVVGIARGGIENFENASGTAYEAPDPALPLLSVMQAEDAEVRAQYYTEETPISEVDATLSDGGFTGYLELSENVLSGDYFLVYHGGTSSAVGFVGAAERLISGDEAFETAADEVGIYKVRQVDIDPVEIPEPTEADDAGTAGDPDIADPADDADEVEETKSGVESTAEPTARDTAESEPAEPSASSTEASDTSVESTESSGPPGGEASGDSAESSNEPGESTRGSEGASDRSTAARTATSADRTTTNSANGTRSGSATGHEPSGQSASPRSEPTASEAVDLETRSVPSLDPQRSTPPEPDTPPTPSEPDAPPAPAEPAAEPEPTPTSGGEPEPAEATAVADLEDEIADREAEIERLESELAAAREERDDLAAEVERLESEVERLEERLGGAADTDRRLSPAEAIGGTNLFVEYESKSDATLARAKAGSANREEVAGNLRLGIHTEFEAEGVSVDGAPFDEWLRSTLEFRFAEWLVGTLIFEIRETGHADELADLFEALPEIRRVEFDGVVDIETEEETGEERFDVIFRHRMGDPLVVANLNDARDPATGGMMEQLVTAAERVGRSADSLSSAVLVTSSFFESGALETVSEATRSGILTRDKRTSFVNLTRKRGYHLCLVAAREGNFHLEVPEL